MRYRLFLLTAVALLTASLAMGQEGPHVTGVEPAAGKVDSNVTVTGKNLDKDSVVSVYLSDDATDYKAAVVEQSTDKIVLKVPNVKPGGYNISIQVDNNILIEPIRFTVEQ